MVLFLHIRRRGIYKYSVIEGNPSKRGARAAMKVTTVMVFVVAVVAALVLPQVTARSVAVDQVSSALQESMSSLNSKRSEWFENYSTLNNLTKTTKDQLEKLQHVSNSVLPLVWYFYKLSVKLQNNYYPKVLDTNDGTFLPKVALPFHHTTALAGNRLGLNFYLEATFSLHNYRDFQVRISKDGDAVFYLKMHFNERQAVMGYVQEQQEIEKIVLEGDRFPAIQLYKLFRVNVQVMTDCMVASFWLDNLDLAMMSPLPEKHIWCSRDYSYGENVSFDISVLDGSQEEELQQEQKNDHSSEGQEIDLVSVVVYNGFIYM